ncbi:large-conductance mechanosensitive channel protein MscL [Lysobacter sp. SG-8]|uniref:Large-conductance mechanosensitive channel n=1 Tax=Marilutibacter penaei TaxID=2759900 RepID=A0A7W3YDZ5_9GAMM|nr:large-conductance mechanosensitive channel protein MscL [Lysobacter penaei]MBB1088259.1 large-conductance mechanosensitive channel protein MscL [Lysobacter penaei]
MGMISEFREFIARGNVIDLAVAVVIGAAFGKIVTALVDGIIMPLVGGLTGGASVSDWKYVLTPASVDAAGTEVAEVAVAYGAFIQTVIDFLIIAFVIFLVLKGYNRLKKKEEAAEEAPAEPAEEIVLLREIRDALKK